MGCTPMVETLIQLLGGGPVDLGKPFLMFSMVSQISLGI